MAASGCTSPVMEMKGIHCHYNLPYRNRCMALSALTLLFLSGRTNTQYSPSTASSPISLWRVFYFSKKIMIGWHGFIIPIRCVLQWQVQLKFRCHRFGHMSLTDTASTGSFEGTAVRLHTKRKTRLDSQNIKTGFDHEENYHYEFSDNSRKMLKILYTSFNKSNYF